MSNNLSDKAKKAIAEEEVFGKKISREVNLKWNRMEQALEKEDIRDFINLSYEVQSLLKVLADGDIDFVRDNFGGARYCIVETGEWDIAGSLVNDVRNRIEGEVTPLDRGWI